MNQKLMVASVVYRPEHDAVEVLMVDPTNPDSPRIKMFYRAQDPNNKCRCAVSGCGFPSGHIGNHRTPDGHFIGNNFEVGLQAERIKVNYLETKKKLEKVDQVAADLRDANQFLANENAALKVETQRLRRTINEIRGAQSYEAQQLHKELQSLRPQGKQMPVGDREMREMVRREVGESAVAQVKGIEKPVPMMISCQGDWEP